MDMQVAGQWRREWAGTAEYGDVIEGGVTRRVARAMEVLNASAPGARVRVMRAAYHSTAGPGVPASTYLMHSSRQVISSGNHFLEQSSSPIKPLEISSTPLESSHDSEAERENYKVTEPDDFEISEPSKWIGSSSKSSIRLPSEESSSADNASIIDLDSRANSRNSFRRSFRRKEDPILEGHKTNPRVSPLLDAPIALSTLKYTSLLNGSDDWNNRRKSYSFEDPAPSQTSFNKRVRQEKDKFTFDSSTDSGICKSSEIVDDQRNFSHTDKSPFESENNTFRDWLSKNRSYKMKPSKIKHFDDENSSSNISLKSTGKVTITLPVTIESDTASESVSNSNEDSERKIKRVEFCKTELHFAAESGTVNIIATDEKPPPTNDFRKKRSAFVPLKDRFEKPITLFGDKSDLFNSMTDEMKINNQNDENTAATKSILKNKIPKPKPYLLGENMEFGNVDNNSSKPLDTFSAPTSVSLINRELQSARHTHSSTYPNDTADTSIIPHEVSKTNSKGLDMRIETNHTIVRDHVIAPIRRVKKSLSPEPQKSKSRELRKTDLAYFGIYNGNEKNIPSQDNLQEEIFHSVRLVQQVSNSVSNSEVDSDEAPEYENLSTRYNQMIPTPKPRTKYKSELTSLKESGTLLTIPERVNETVNDPRRAALSKSSTSDDAKDKSSRLKTSKSNVTRGSPAPRHIKKDEASFLKKEINNNNPNIKERSVTPLYMNIKTPTDRVASEKHTRTHSVSQSDNNKYTKDRSSKRLSKSPDHKNKIIEKVETTRNEKILESTDKVDQNNYIKSTKDKIDRLATPKHRAKYEVIEDSLTKKKTLASNNPNDRNDNNDSNTRSTSSRRKLLDTSKHSLTKSIRNNDKENKRDTVRENTNGKVLSSPVQLEMATKSKHGEEDTNDRKTNISLEKPKKMKRSEYVINYDDKNGTVSSIRKIVNGTNSHRKIKTSVDSKDSPVQYTRKNTVSNKIASLQRPDHQTVKDKLEYKYRMRKSKMNVPKTCQLL